MYTFEYFMSHPKKDDINFSKTYSKYRRLQHHQMYLVCLFQIDKSN